MLTFILCDYLTIMDIENPITVNLFKTIENVLFDIEDILLWEEIPKDKYIVFYYFGVMDTVYIDGIRMPINRVYVVYGLITKRLFQLVLRPEGTCKCLPILREYNDFLTKNNSTDYVIVLEKGEDDNISEHYTKNLSDFFPLTASFRSYFAYEKKFHLVDESSSKYILLRNICYDELEEKQWTDLEIGTYLFVDICFSSLPGELESNFPKYFIVDKMPEKKEKQKRHFFKYFVTPSCPWKTILDQNEFYFSENFYLNDNVIRIKKETNRIITRNHYEPNFKVLQLFYHYDDNYMLFDY